MTDHIRPKVKFKKRKEPFCTVEGCGRDTFAKGLCSAHYQRNYKYGDPSELRVFRYPQDDLDKAMRLYAAGVSRHEIAAETGLKVDYVGALASKLGIKRKPKDASKNRSEASTLRWARYHASQK